MTQPTPTATMFICQQCGMQERDAEGNKVPNPAAQALAAAAEALLADMPVRVVLTRCLSVCDKGVAWGLRAEGKHVFTFAPATNAEELAATARTYATLPAGQTMKKTLMPEGVRGTLLTRIPPEDRNS